MGPPSERGTASGCLRSRSRERLREEPPRDRERLERRLPGEAERRRERERDRERECGDRDLLRRCGNENKKGGNKPGEVVSMKQYNMKMRHTSLLRRSRSSGSQ